MGRVINEEEDDEEAFCGWCQKEVADGDDSSWTVNEGNVAKAAFIDVVVALLVDGLLLSRVMTKMVSCSKQFSAIPASFE